MPAGKLMCPSSVCAEGATLLGIVMPDGRVAFASEPITVDAAFVETARQGRPPEQRFRFSTACARGACGQWTGSRCGVIDAAIAADVGADEGDQHGDLPRCSIRASCRWFHQIGGAACRACTLIVTDQRGARDSAA